MSLKEYAAEGGTALDEAAEPIDRFAHISLNLIVHSRTNPRTSFDPVKLQELADSIKAKGVDTPIILRPLPGDRLQETYGGPGPKPAYELVTGARRLKASELAGMEDIPARIRSLTDAEALETQMVENLQREGLNPLEEAEGYEQLMKHAGVGAVELATKIGKSKGYVYASLKLLDLFPAARKALSERTIDFSKALPLARIPNETLQNKALTEVTTKTYSRPDGMSARQVADHVQDQYMLQLKKATFKIADADLLPAAGACTTCTKRTGYAPDLFTDVKGPDMCIDPPCFHKKEKAQAATIVEAAKAKGQTVIAGKEAQELVTNTYQQKLKGYKRLDVADDSPTGQTLRKIIGAQMKAEGIQPVMVESQHKKGDLVATLPNEVVLRLLKTVQGQAEAAEKVSKEVLELVDEKKAKAEARAKAGYEQHWRDRLLARTWAVVGDGGTPAFTLEVHRFLLLRELRGLSGEDATAVAELLGLGKVGATNALFDYARTTVSPDLLQLLLIMQRASGADSYTYENNERVNNVGLMLIARTVFQDDLAIVTQEVQREAMDKFFPKPLATSKGRKKADPAEAPKGDLHLAPAARASTSRGKAKGKKAEGLAAPDGAKPTLKRKATAQETMEGIASAMQGIEASALADAGQSAGVDEPAGVAGDTVPGIAAALQGEEAPALAGARPVMYRCAKTGATWSGRGQRPAWFRAHIEAGGTLEELHVGVMAQTPAAAHAAPVDPQYQVAFDLIVREQKASLRLLKAEMGIGQAKAEKLLSALEAAGKVSACDERGARKVLVVA